MLSIYIYIQNYNIYIYIYRYMCFFAVAESNVLEFVRKYSMKLSLEYTQPRPIYIHM